MKLIKVESTHIQAIGWEANFKFQPKRRARDTLRIKFNNDSVYDYPGVSKEVFEDFLDAKSKGSFFERKIKDRYPTIKRK